MSQAVWFVGFRDRVPQAFAGDAVLLSMGELLHAHRDRPHAIVLGDDAVKDASPRDVRRWLELRKLLDRLVICAPRTEPGRVTAWWAAGMTNIVTFSELPDAIDRLASCVRPLLALEEWTPAKGIRDPEAAALLSLVPRLPEMTVEGWADARGVSVRTLERDCLRLVRMGPKDVLDRYERAALARLWAQQSNRSGVR